MGFPALEMSLESVWREGELLFVPGKTALEKTIFVRIIE